MKEYADHRRHAKTSDIHEGDWVLVRQERKTKEDSRYYAHPLQVARRKGTMISAESGAKGTTRNMSHFKKCDPTAYAQARQPDWDTDVSSQEESSHEESRRVSEACDVREGHPSSQPLTGRPRRTVQRPIRLIEEL